MQNTNNETYRINENNSTNGIFEFKKLFFKTNGTAFNTKDKLVDLMVFVYESNSYNETFSVLQIQRFLTEVKNQSSSGDLSKLTIILEKATTRSAQLNTIEVELDVLHDKISREQSRFEAQDTIANDWFVSVFQSISKMKNSIIFLKEALNYKMRIIEEIKIIFSKIIYSEEDFNKADNLVLKLKESLDHQHLQLEHIYAEIEEINETNLEAIRTRVCRNRSPFLFQPSNCSNNMDDNQLSSINSSRNPR